MSCIPSSNVYGNKPSFPCTTQKSGGTPFYSSKECCPQEPKPLDLAETLWVDFPFILQDAGGPGGSIRTLGLPTPIDETEGATARYYINGKVMHLQYSYRFSAAAPSSGVGTYFIKLPNGYTYNNLSQQTVGSVVGNAASGSNYTGSVSADFMGDNKRLVAYINDATNPVSAWGELTVGDIGLANQSIFFNAAVEIV